MTDDSSTELTGYLNLTKISDLNAISDAVKTDVNSLLSVYNSKSIGSLSKALWLPPSNAAIEANTKPEYIESTDGKFRGVVYFANIGQDIGFSLDSMIVMTDGNYVYQLQVNDVTSKYNSYDKSDANVQNSNNEYLTYLKTLTSKSSGEPIITDFNNIYKLVAGTVSRK